MAKPKISVLLTTVRGDQGYAGRPELHTLKTVCDDLSTQSYQDFELIIVDGLKGGHPCGHGYDRPTPTGYQFPIIHVPPIDNLWTRHRKVAISTYRSSGLIYAAGELVCNIDDACCLPPTYLETFWLAYQRGYCAAMTWPRRNDNRRPGIVTGPGHVFGFGSYSLDAAIVLNSYDIAFDGSQGLEDIDWSTRLYHLGVKQVLLDIQGFDILPQTGHDPRAIDLARPLERCCNQSWQTQRVQRQVRQANRPELWTREWVEKIIGPCQFAYRDTRKTTLQPAEYQREPAAVTKTESVVVCRHHNLPCPYVDRGFVFERTWFHEQLLEHPPVFDLVQARAEARR